MGERTDAKRSIESSARHMSEIAEELSRRASPRYIGEQAREKALNKTHEWKEEMTTSPTALSLIGGALGAATRPLSGRAGALRNSGTATADSDTAAIWGTANGPSTRAIRGPAKAATRRTAPAGCGRRSRAVRRN